MPARRGNVGDPTTRNALLDATQALMRDRGYAAVTTRQVAAGAGVDSALVAYYFGSLDGLFVALFQRGAERSFERLQEALGSEQPLWGYWDLIHDASGSAMTSALQARDPIFRQELLFLQHPVLDLLGGRQRPLRRQFPQSGVQSAMFLDEQVEIHGGCVHIRLRPFSGLLQR